VRNRTSVLDAGTIAGDGRLPLGPGPRETERASTLACRRWERPPGAHSILAPLWLTPISLWQRDREPGAARHVEARPDHERPELPRPTPLGRGRVAGSGRSWV